VPKPVVIGVGYPQLRIATIYPQPQTAKLKIRFGAARRASPVGCYVALLCHVVTTAAGAAAWNVGSTAGTQTNAQLLLTLR
jgi:hypothetical protein